MTADSKRSSRNPSRRRSPKPNGLHDRQLGLAPVLGNVGTLVSDVGAGVGTIVKGLVGGGTPPTTGGGTSVPTSPIGNVGSGTTATQSTPAPGSPGVSPPTTPVATSAGTGVKNTATRSTPAPAKSPALPSPQPSSPTTPAPTTLPHSSLSPAFNTSPSPSPSPNPSPLSGTPPSPSSVGLSNTFTSPPVVPTSPSQNFISLSSSSPAPSALQGVTGSPLSSAASVPPGSQSASALPAGVLVSTATGSTSLSGLTSGLGLTSSGNSAPVVTSAGSTGSLSQAPLPNGSSSLQGLPQTSDSPSSTATSADGSNAGGPAPSDSVGGGKAGLAGGAIAGIVIGLLALFAGLAFFVWRVRKKRAKERRMKNILSQTYPFAKGFGGQGGDAKEYAGDTYTRSSPSVRSIPFAAYHPRPYSTASGESDPFGTRSIFPTQQQGHTQGLPEMRQQRNLNAIAVNANVGSFNPVPSISVDGHSSTKSASYAWHEAGGGEGDLHASTSPTRRHDGMLMTGRGLVAARDVGGEEHLQGVYVRHSNSPRTPVEEKSPTELFPQSAEIVDPFRRSLPPVKNFKLPRVQPKYNLSPTDPTPITPSSQYQTPHDEDPFGDPQHFRQQGGAQSSNDNFVSASSHDHNHDGYTSARESYRSSAGSTTYSCYDIDAVTAATPGTAGNRFVASAAANDRAGGAGEGEDVGDSMSEADSYHSASDTRPNTANEDFDTRYNKLFKAITGKGVSEGFRDSQLTVRQTQPGGGRTDSNATFSTIMYGDRGGLNDASVSSGSGSGVGSRGGAASSSSYAFSDRDDSSSSGRMSFDRYSATSGDPFALEKGLLGRTPSYASSSKMVPFPNVGLPGIAEDDLRDSVRRESQRGVYWRDGGDDDDTAKIGDYIGHPEVQGAIDFRRI